MNVAKSPVTGTLVIVPGGMYWFWTIVSLKELHHAAANVGRVNVEAADNQELENANDDDAHDDYGRQHLDEGGRLAVSAVLLWFFVFI